MKVWNVLLPVLFVVGACALSFKGLETIIEDMDETVENYKKGRGCH